MHCCCPSHADPIPVALSTSSSSDAPLPFTLDLSDSSPSPSPLASSSLTPLSSNNNSTDLSLSDGHLPAADEENDVMCTPPPLAPSTQQVSRAAFPFPPSTPQPDATAEESTFRRLNFTTKECATPGRYDARHKLGVPLAVYCRVKPIMGSEGEVASGGVGVGVGGSDAEGGSRMMQLEGDSTLLCCAPKDSASFKHGETHSKFTFSRVFGPEATQEEVFQHTTRPIVDAFYKGQNGLIFAYGITASGKTYTMQGTKENPGLIPRIVADLFGKVLEDVTADGSPKFTVTCSYLEIYNETINDLLVESARPKTAAATTNGGKSSSSSASSSTAAPVKPAVCKLQSSKSDEVAVVNLREVEIKTHRDAFSLLQQGQSCRSQHETALNSDSSRSHSVFTLKLLAANGAVWARLSVVDLAGSERTKRVTVDAAGSNGTGSSNGSNASTGTGTAAAAGKEGRMRETVNINQSLLVLGRCLDALRYNQSGPKKPRVVPFRESQITRLFKDSLCGWGRTVMLANASQSPADYDETVHALKYAAVAKEIRVATKVDSRRAKAVATPTHNKRQPSQPLIELDEMEHAANGTGSSQWDDDSDGSNPPYDTLLDECFRLRQTVVALEVKAAEVEWTVREELTAQYEEQMQEAEEAANERAEKEYKRAEEKYKKMLQIWKAEQEYEQSMNAADISSSSSSSSSSSAEVTSLRRELLSVRSELSDRCSALSASDLLLESTKEMLKESHSAHSTTQKRLKQAEKEVQQQQTEIEEMRLLREEKQNEWKKREEEQENELSRVGELQEELATLQAAHTRLESAHSTLTASHSALLARQSEMEEAKNQLEQESLELQQSLANAQSELKNTMKEGKKERDHEMKEMKKAHDAEVKSLKKSLKEEQKARESMEHQLTQRLSELESTQHQSALSSESAVATATATISRLESDLSAAQTDAATLRSQLSDARAEISARREEEEKEKKKQNAAVSEREKKQTEEAEEKEEQIKEAEKKIKEMEKLMKELKKEKENELKETKKIKENELKEMKKSHKEEVKRVNEESEETIARLQEQLSAANAAVAAAEAAAASATAAAAAATAAAASHPAPHSHLLISAPASDPLSDTWGQLLSPIKAQSEEHAAANGAAVRGGKKSVAGTKRTTSTARANTARGSMTSSLHPLSHPLISQPAVALDDELDPFAFDASIILKDGDNDCFIEEDDYMQIVEGKKKTHSHAAPAAASSVASNKVSLSGAAAAAVSTASGAASKVKKESTAKSSKKKVELPAAAEEEEPSAEEEDEDDLPKKKRKTTTSKASSKKSLAATAAVINVADKENSAAAENATTKPVRAKRK